jgi:hypothetical protein
MKHLKNIIICSITLLSMFQISAGGDPIAENSESKTLNPLLLEARTSAPDSNQDLWLDWDWADPEIVGDTEEETVKNSSLNTKTPIPQPVPNEESTNVLSRPRRNVLSAIFRYFKKSNQQVLPVNK